VADAGGAVDATRQNVHVGVARAAQFAAVMDGDRAVDVADHALRFVHSHVNLSNGGRGPRASDHGCAACAHSA